MRFLLSLLFFSCFLSLIHAASPPSSVSLSNPSSSAATVQLYKYLLSQYGKKVLSGQQEFMEAGRLETKDINYIKSVSGLEVAVGGFDVMDYTPSRAWKGANANGFTETWINWARGNDGKKLGIVSLCWHWNSPADLKDENDWWTGFYTTKTNFNIESVLNAGPSDSRYQMLLRDIDAIAVELKKFKNNDIPVLWRPLHEAYGQWFWWSAKGTTAFKQLWNLVYDRLTNYHQLNNLIWVYTGEAKSSSGWTPDESKWDIYSLDLYLNPNGKTDETSWSSEWNNVVSKYNGRKLVALSETGSLPTPSRVRSSNTYWSWAMTWDGKFIRDIDQNRIRSWMQDSSLVITRSNIDDWRNFVYVPTVFSIVWKANTGRVFDISEEKNQNGIAVLMWNPTGGWNQKFEWVNGEQIRWVGTDKCLDVKDGSNVNGNVIFIWECSSNNANNNQKFVKEGDLIRWKGTDKCLQVSNGDNSAGARVGIWTCNSNNGAQQFFFQ